MARHPHDQQSGRPPRVFVWLAAIVAPVAMLGGFANASASQPAEVVTETVREVVTEYRTAAPGAIEEVGGLASERARLTRVKRKLNAVKGRLERRRAELDAREAALDRREDALSGAGAGTAGR